MAPSTESGAALCRIPCWGSCAPGTTGTCSSAGTPTRYKWAGCLDAMLAPYARRTWLARLWISLAVIWAPMLRSMAMRTALLPGSMACRRRCLSAPRLRLPVAAARSAPVAARRTSASAHARCSSVPYTCTSTESAPGSISAVVNPGSFSVGIASACLPRFASRPAVSDTLGPSAALVDAGASPAAQVTIGASSRARTSEDGENAAAGSRMICTTAPDSSSMALMLTPPRPTTKPTVLRLTATTVRGRSPDIPAGCVCSMSLIRPCRCSRVAWAFSTRFRLRNRRFLDMAENFFAALFVSSGTPCSFRHNRYGMHRYLCFHFLELLPPTVTCEW
eukprot:m.784157 g.784157  ORF g.784157 m.784157 type:complete len:334 (-) comp23296_c0_seq3:1857-2858(-)